VRPDDGHGLDVSPEQSEKLRDLWLRQTLRPGISSEPLPLDDRDTDVERRQALDTLLRMMKK